MSKKKVVTERFINNGVIVNEETGEINKPDGNYEIQIKKYVDYEEDEKVKLMT